MFILPFLLQKSILLLTIVRNHTIISCGNSTKSYLNQRKGFVMESKLHNVICKINCLTEEVNSLYHQASLKLGVTDSVSFVLYMTYINDGKCLLYNIYKLSGISKQTINSAIRKLEMDEIIYLEKLNGKSKIVCLTEKGNEFAEKTAKKLYEAERNAFSSWNDEEINQYLMLIEKHSNSLKEQFEKL